MTGRIEELKNQYARGNLTYHDAVQAVIDLGHSINEAEDIVSDWDAGEWSY